MKTIELSLNERIELRFQLSDDSYSTSCFLSNIHSIISENEYLITPPDNIDTSKWLGRVIAITTPREDGAYIAQAKILNQVNENSSVFLHIELIKNFIRKQRREFFRLKIELDVNIDGYGCAKTVNISGNGMAILSENNFEEGEQVKGSINLKGDIIYFIGDIVRCQGVSHNYNLVCMHLNNIDQKAQDAIVKFIYNQQISMMDNNIPL